MSDGRLDLSEAMRLMYAARATTEGPDGGMALEDVYFDLRAQAWAALSPAMHRGFDALLPAPQQEGPVAIQRLSALAGFLEGVVTNANLTRRLGGEAEAEGRRVEDRRERRVHAANADATDAARAENEGYRLGRGAEEGAGSRR